LQPLDLSLSEAEKRVAELENLRDELQRGLMELVPQMPEDELRNWIIFSDTLQSAIDELSGETSVSQ